jgi:thimet oligopeptidase
MNTFMKRSLVVGLTVATTACRATSLNAQVHQNEVESIIRLFPKTADELKARTALLKKQMEAHLAAIIAIPADERTFEKTMRPLDELIGGYYSQEREAIIVMGYVSPDTALRQASQDAAVQLGQFMLARFKQNSDVYRACKEYVEGNKNKEKLSDEQNYFINDLMRSFIRSGLDLPEEQRDKVSELEQALIKTMSDFSCAIADDQTKVLLKHNELAGVDEDLIAALPRQDDDTYAVGLDYPTYFAVIKHCTNAKTREKMYIAFRNRACPQNIRVLEEIVAQRDELAHLLGYTSYAAYSLAEEMVGSVDRADNFLQDLVTRADRKAKEEYALLVKELPEGVELATSGKIQQWDKAFVKERYKEKHFNLDERKVSEYFPTEQTIQGLLEIYAQFFSLEFKDIPAALWDADARMIEIIHVPTDTLLGYCILDLHPRSNKFSHACHMSIIRANKNPASPASVSVVIANFPKATASKPSLLTLKDVRTFFHEFGHEVHAMFGRTEIKALAGTSTKMDFVELPSQMLEEWLWDKEILKNLSSHYQTGSKSPDALLDTVIALKNFDIGDFILQQSFQSRLSLDYHKEDRNKNTTEILHRLCKDIISTTECCSEDHMQASFGHLTEYGPRYYGYLWSQVFAKDVFDQIKKEGLLNPVVGARYVGAVLSKGGSKDPNDLLKDFLGREPNSDAFFRDLGLDQ